MKYFIISSFIGAVVAILLLAFYTSLSKTDKSFLIFLIVAFIVGGYYFKVKDEQEKNRREEEKSVNLDTTLKNTKELKIKSDEIIKDLESSIANARELDNLLKSSNNSLENIEKEMVNQIELLNKNLRLTEEFERKIAQQLVIQKKIFDSEKAQIMIPSERLTFTRVPGDSTKIGLKFFVLNMGKRPALNLKNMAYAVIFNNGKVEQILRNSTMIPYEQLNGERNSSYYRIIFEDLGEIKNDREIVFVITCEYADSSDPLKAIYQINYFRFYGPKNDEAQFFEATEQQKNQINEIDGIKKELLPFIN